MNVLIIEDEILAQQELTNILYDIDSSIHIIKCIQSVYDSVLWLPKNQKRCDLIFMDIELSDGQCFEIFSKIHVETPIVFLTAYHEYAIKAFKVNSIDYLLKPIDKRELKRALDKHYRIKQKNATISLKEVHELVYSQNKKYKERFSIKIGDIYKYITLEKIAYFFSDQKYTHLRTYNKETYIIDFSLNELEEKLNPNLFFRITRKYLVHINSIETASKFFNSRLKIQLNPPTRDNVVISRVKVVPFLDWIAGD